MGYGFVRFSMLYMKSKRLLVVLFIVAIGFKTQVNAQQQYRWKSVQIHGGGFVDGIIYHPTEKGLLYCRTDMGGAYKWNNNLNQWQPLMDWVTYNNNNLMGVESIALDPTDPNRLYMACGTYTGSPGPNAILVSNDRGSTFKRVDVPFRMGGNENGRGNGERMAVDPNDGNIIYMGTRIDGLWKSEDKGNHWSHVEGIAPIQAGTDNFTGKYRPKPAGIIFVLFNPKSKAGGKSAVIYAGISQKGTENIFRSTDAGLTWAPVPSQPVDVMPTHAVLSADGSLYVTYGSNPGPDGMTDGAVYKLNTATNIWTNITPVKPVPGAQEGFGYAAVSVDAQHPQNVIVSTFNHYKFGGEDIFRSTDGGQSWKPIFTGTAHGRFDYTSAPYISHTGIHWLFDIEIDPFNSNHALFTTGYGLHETFDLADADHDKPTTWTIKNDGIEETVALALLSPPQGVPLISAIGDYGGFVHNDLDKPEPGGNFNNPRFSNTTDVACASKKSNIIVRVGEGSNSAGGGNIGYSLNGGKTWQASSTQPQQWSKGGSISISATGSSWVWTPQRSAPYITFDDGNTWKQVTGLPGNTRVIADPVNTAKFYAIDLFGGKLFTSTDSGKTFAQHDLNLPNGLPGQGSHGDARGGQNRLYAAPGNESDLWLPATDGLYHTIDVGKPFMQVKGVEQVHAFGFGKAAPGKNYPAIFLAGTIKGTGGIFRSEDEGKNWVRINDDKHNWGIILQLSGDPKKYGRVYVGTHGRGIIYGDIATNN